ncbi:MAG TPA: SIMPL domain-containing protein, partial [Candidatus Polarisedimenticolaceae bacterium]|nr:SIMPL domain-containing protein [Candidatus Polarisedimenticolaceae bacterium]
QLTPQPSFSEAQKEELTRKAEAKAIANAREKADTLATNLDAKRGKVITVTNQNDIPGPYPMVSKAADSASSSASLPVQPGINEFSYQVSVKFALQ